MVMVLPKRDAKQLLDAYIAQGELHAYAWGGRSVCGLTLVHLMLQSVFGCWWSCLASSAGRGEPLQIIPSEGVRCLNILRLLPLGFSTHINRIFPLTLAACIALL